MTALKFKHGTDKGVMHYVEFENKIVGLSVYDSQKVSHIITHGYLDVAFDLKAKEFNTVNVSISTDTEYLSKVYNDMLQKENTYFKEGMVGLCVLVFQNSANHKKKLVFDYIIKLLINQGSVNYE